MYFWMILVVRWGGGNNTLDEVMFNLVSASLRRSYNSVNKVVWKYFFKANNNKRAALIECALGLLVQQNP